MNKLINPLNVVYKYSKLISVSLPLLFKSAPRETTFMAVALLLQGVIPAISVWINKQVVDAVAATSSVKGYNFGTIGSLVASWVGAILLEAILSPLVATAQGNLSEKLTAHLNLLLMSKSESLPDLTRFEDSKFYDELQLLQQQATYQPTNLLVYLADGLPAVFTIVTMLALLLPISWWIPLLILATSIPQTYVSFKLQQDAWETMVVKSPQARRMQYYSSVMLTDTYAKEVRLFELGSWFMQLYREVFQDKHRAMRRIRSKQAFSSSGLAVFSALGNAIAFYWLVQQAFSGRLSPGSVLVFVQSLAYTQQNLSWLISSFTMLYETLLYMESFFNFLKSKPTMSVRIPGKPVPVPILGITFDNVHFSYPDGRTTLTEINFTLQPGERVALVGENGAGKTTLVKLLARLYDPTHGNILIDGESLKNLDIRAWRQQIAVVFQDFCSYAFTIKENIALGNIKDFNNLERLEYSAQKSGINTLITRLPEGYETLLGKQFNGTELSGGEQQKLALARAFMRAEDSQILILDEPTAALDPRSEYEIYSRFSELVLGKTTIFVTHRLASVRMADRILVMKAGYLIEDGTHQELLQHGGEYATLWNMQAKQYGF